MLQKTVLYCIKTQRIPLELIKQVVLMFTVHEFNSHAFEGGRFDQVMTTVFLISHLTPIFIPCSDLQGNYANVDTETLKQKYLSSSVLSKT